ncbi:hypothetical protein F4860DRAFT_346461 [Xylaria cubensis]|nr:hypothetical protein F4860DRAFT_346461 [Xylaria cubensis]
MYYSSTILLSVPTLSYLSSHIILMCQFWNTSSNHLSLIWHLCLGSSCTAANQPLKWKYGPKPVQMKVAHQYRPSNFNTR